VPQAGHTQPKKESMTFQFAAPWLLTLLFVIPLLAYVLQRRHARHQTAGLRFASVGLLRHQRTGARPCAHC
jgi:hypothetical protein